MSGNAPEGTGYVGILTPDQTKALKKLWAALEEVQENGTVTVVPEPAAAPEPAPVASGWGGGWFSAAPAAPVVEPPVTITLSEIGITPVEIKTTLSNIILGDNPDALVLRFLRARKWNVGNGLLMLLNAFKWRLTEDVENVKVLGDDELDIKYPKFKDQLEMGKFYVHGTDRKGQPVVYLNVHLHKSTDQDPKTLERLTLYLMETGRLLIQPPVETVTLVFDLSQFGLANMDYGLVQFLVKCFQAYYPESLGTILVHNAPLVFWGVWKVIEGWLDPVVAAKIKFTYKNTELIELIPAEHLPDSFQDAGLDKFNYEYLPPVPGENDLMQDEATKEVLLGEWKHLIKRHEANTKVWVRSEDHSLTNPVQAERDAIAKELRSHYYKLQPYIRAKNQFQRKNSVGISVIQPDGSVKWTYNN